MPYGVLTTWPEHAMPSASLRTTDRLIITCHRAPADIPKTGGTSLHTALRNAQYDVPGSHRGQERCFHAPGLCGEPDCVRPCSYSRYGLTRCHAVAKNRSVVNLVMLRSPRRHVASQYYECRYSLWGRLTTGVQCNLRTGECAGPMSKSSNFSALFVRDMSFYSGLHAWVAHYASNLSRPVPEYGCYNPRNMQSRALTCQQPDIFASHSEAGHALPSSDEAIAQAARIDVLGVTELFAESLCVLHFTVRGMLPSHCACAGRSGAAIATDHQRPTAFLHAPTLTSGEGNELQGLPAETASLIDSITREDARLYSKAFSMVLQRIQQVEASTGVRILCPQN